jgi:acetyltransferase-like isoleucine patch superfamily enzyme
VTRDVADRTIVAGVPARKLRTREDDELALQSNGTDRVRTVN